MVFYLAEALGTRSHAGGGFFVLREVEPNPLQPSAFPVPQREILSTLRELRDLRGASLLARCMVVNFFCYSFLFKSLHDRKENNQ